MELKSLKLWTMPDSYCGETYEEYYCGPGRSRDSKILEDANFIAFLEAVGGESTEGVYVTRASHWAVGWVEQILIHKDADPNTLATADECLTAIHEYGILDDSLYCSMEFEAEMKDYEDYTHSALCVLWEKDPSNYKMPEGYGVWQLPKMEGDDFQYWTTSLGGFYVDEADALWWLVYDLNETLDVSEEQEIDCPFRDNIPAGVTAYQFAMDKTNQNWDEDGLVNYERLYPVWRDTLKNSLPKEFYQPPRTELGFTALELP